MNNYLLAFSDQYIDVDLCPAGYGDVVEGEKTYKTVGKILKKTGSCLLGWNDQDFTHLDILFTLRPKFKGNIQGGLRPTSDLFVSLMRVGAFAFEINRKESLDYYYIDEKLGCTIGGLGSPVKERLTDLINGVLKELQ